MLAIIITMIRLMTATIETFEGYTVIDEHDHKIIITETTIVTFQE